MSGEEASTSHSHGSGTASYEDKQQAPGDSILGRKLKKILESDLETDSETAQALDELSTFFTDNSLHTRRFLRGEIERRSLQGWRIIMFLLISLGLFILITDQNTTVTIVDENSKACISFGDSFWISGPNKYSTYHNK